MAIVRLQTCGDGDVFEERADADGHAPLHVRADADVGERRVDEIAQRGKAAPQHAAGGAGGSVILRASAEPQRVVIQVQDGCGGIPVVAGDPFRPFGHRRGADRTGLGLGLSIARKAIRAQGGDITIENLPGRGCIFSIELPTADSALAEAPLAVPVP